MEKKINNRIKEKNKTTIPIAILERARRVRFVRRMARLSMKEFAEHCNLGLTTVNYWEQGYSSITNRGAKKVSEAMRGEGIECSKIWLLYGLGPTPKITDPTKLSKINYYTFDSKAQSIQEEHSSYSNEKFEKELKLFQTLHPENLVYFINDDAMAPNFCKEDVVAGKKLTGEMMQLANSLDCIVEIEKNKFVRRVKVGHSTNGFDLYVINSEASLEFPPLRNVKINSLAPIIRIWKPLKF